MEKMRIAGVIEKAPEVVTIPEITAEENPAEMGDAEQEDNFEIVGDEDIDLQSAQTAHSNVTM
jgi:hypothetical protein